jgi:hypothetical protein
MSWDWNGTGAAERPPAADACVFGAQVLGIDILMGCKGLLQARSFVFFVLCFVCVAICCRCCVAH